MPVKNAESGIPTFRGEVDYGASEQSSTSRNSTNKQQTPIVLAPCPAAALTGHRVAAAALRSALLPLQLPQRELSLLWQLLTAS